MKFKKFIVCLGIVLGVVTYSASFISLPTSTITAYAEGSDIGDDVDGGNGESTEDNGVTDYFKNYNAMTSDQMQDATEKVSPITNIFGYVIGAIIALVTAGIFVITALDLAYIGIPPVRSLLFVDGQTQGGYGMQQQNTTHEKRQWVSDEAVQCATLIGNNQNPQQGGGMMGMYGGGAMPQQQNQTMPTKSVIGVYFKKRVIFIILFVICTVMLTSSIFLGTGINLAQWFMKLVEMINNSIPR